MKKSLSMILVFALIVSMFSSVALAAAMSTQEKYEALRKDGIFAGFPDGSARLHEKMTRAQFAVVASKIFGLNVSAANAPAVATFNDVPGTPPNFQWAYRFVEAAAKAYYFVGDRGSFGPARNVSVEEMAIVYVKALGLSTNDSAVVAGTSSWSTKYVDAAIRAGIIASTASFKNDATRAQLVDASYQVHLVVSERNRIPTVASVTAINLKQVEIKFDRAVTAAAANISSYKVGLAASPGTNVAGSVVVAADHKSAIITLSGANKFVNFSTANYVSVSKSVGLAADYVNAGVQANDTTVPSAVGVIATGARRFTIWFSEPLDNTVSSSASVASVQLDSGTVALDPASAVYDAAARTLTVRTNSVLTEGTHTIKVNMTGTNLMDLSGYKVIPNTLSFSYVKDATPPSVAILSSTEKTVTFQFNEAVNNVKSANVVFSHTYSGANPVLGSSGAVVMNSASTYTVTFPNPLPPGLASVFIGYASPAGIKITNDAGIAYTGSVMTANTVADATKPTVNKVEFVNANSVRVTFSENLNEPSAETTANYVLKTAAGDAVAVVAAVLQADANTVVLTTGLMNSGSYLLTVKAVKDASVSGNAAVDQTIHFTGVDTIPPTVVDKVAGGAINVLKVTSTKVVVEFSEAMDRASIENKANWRYNGVVLAVNDTIVADANNKSVVITIALGVNDGLHLALGQVRDTAGNFITAFTTTLDILPLSTLAPIAIEATGQSTVVLRYAEFITGTTTGDLQVSINNGPWTSPTNLSDSMADSKTTTTLTVPANIINTDVPVNYVRVRTVTAQGNPGVSANMRNAYGTPVNIAAVSAADKIAPKLISSQVTAPKQIKLTYSENIKAGSASIYTYTVAGNTVSSVTNTGNNVIILTMDNAVGNNPTVTQVLDIEDTDGNKINY